jgi:heme-degrading monooxygenase HmoA
MHDDRTGQIAVMFLSRRNADDEAGYGAAAEAMERLAAAQPGYCGIESARGPDGFGITISFWADEASAIAWRNEASHAATRNEGRARWYDRYEVIVAEVSRGYRWARG